MRIASFKVSSVNPVVGRWEFYSMTEWSEKTSFISVAKGINHLSKQFISCGVTSLRLSDFGLETRVINEGKYAFVVDVHSIKN